VLTSVEHKPIHADSFVTLDTYSLYQLFLVANGSERRHEPAVAVISLSNIVCRGAFNKELWFLKNVLCDRQPWPMRVRSAALVTSTRFTDMGWKGDLS
jgi:hypothetical protein